MGVQLCQFTRGGREIAAIGGRGLQHREHRAAGKPARLHRAVRMDTADHAAFAISAGTGEERRGAIGQQLDQHQCFQPAVRGMARRIIAVAREMIGARLANGRIRAEIGPRLAIVLLHRSHHLARADPVEQRGQRRRAASIYPHPHGAGIAIERRIGHVVGRHPPARASLERAGGPKQGKIGVVLRAARRGGKGQHGHPVRRARRRHVRRLRCARGCRERERHARRQPTAPHAVRPRCASGRCRDRSARRARFPPCRQSGAGRPVRCRCGW